MKKSVLVVVLFVGAGFLSAPILVSAQPMGGLSRNAANVARRVSARSGWINRFRRPPTFNQGLRSGARPYISPSIQVGKEAIKPPKTSTIGAPSAHQYIRVQRGTRFLGENLSHKIARKITSTPRPESFPGFTSRFSRDVEIFMSNPNAALTKISVVLEAKYGLEAVAEGSFVRSFEEVKELSLKPVENPVTIGEAMADALEQADRMQSGFFVIRIKGNAHRPKDVLLLDLKYQENGQPFRWISFNKSKSNAWSQRISQQRQAIKNPSLEVEMAEDRRATQGIMMWPEGEGKTGLRVSADGQHWLEYPMEGNSPEALTGQEIWKAWNAGYYVLLPEEQGGTVGFAYAPGKRIFGRVEDVQVSQPTGVNVPSVQFATPNDMLLWKYATTAGFPVEVREGRIFLRFPEDTPKNLRLWQHDETAMRQVSGELLYVKTPNTFKDIYFMEDVILLAEEVEMKYPGRNIVFYPVEDESYEPGTAFRNMLFISKDYKLFSPNIEEILEYEKHLAH